MGDTQHREAPQCYTIRKLDGTAHSAPRQAPLGIIACFPTRVSRDERLPRLSDLTLIIVNLWQILVSHALSIKCHVLTLRNEAKCERATGTSLHS